MKVSPWESGYCLVWVVAPSAQRLRRPNVPGIQIISFRSRSSFRFASRNRRARISLRVVHPRFVSSARAKRADPPTSADVWSCGAASFRPSPLIVGMYPTIGRNFPLLRQLDHVYGRLVALGTAGPAPERGFELPDRRVARTPNGIERNARASLAALAFDFQPTVTAVQALGYCRRRLRRTAEAFHSQ